MKRQKFCLILLITTFQKEVLFDEAFRNSRKGEAKALKEFYNQHKNLYFT